MNLFISPHNDDEVLFGSFVIMRDDPLVVIVFESRAQAARGLSITAEMRNAETVAALKELGASRPPVFIGLPDDRATESGDIMEKVGDAVNIPVGCVYVPEWHALGHHQHNLVARLAQLPPLARHPVFRAAEFVRYTTYTTGGRQNGTPVAVTDPTWIARKHRALACYESQMTLDPRCGCSEHFMRSLEEYTI